jgi:hypothetical protein
LAEYMLCWLKSGIGGTGQPKYLTEHQCDAMRPACQRCSSFGSICIFSDTIDAHHTVLLQRRFSMLEERSDHEHQVLEFLRSSHHADAVRILGCIRAGDDAHSVADFALDLGSAHVASRVMPSDTLPVDQSGANGVTLPTPTGNLLIATREMLPSESSLESLERLHQQEHVPVIDVRGISLPSFQTLLYDTTQRTPTMLAC